MPGYQGNSGFGADYKYLPEPDGIFPTEAYFLLWFFIEIQPPKSLSALSPMTSSRTRTFAFPHDVVNPPQLFLGSLNQPGGSCSLNGPAGTFATGISASPSRPVFHSPTIRFTSSTPSSFIHTSSDDHPTWSRIDGIQERPQDGEVVEIGHNGWVMEVRKQGTFPASAPGRGGRRSRRAVWERTSRPWCSVANVGCSTRCSGVSS